VGKIPPSGSVLDSARIARRRQLRLRMLGIVAGSYALDAVILFLYASAGTTTLRVPALFVVASGLILTTFLALFTSRLGERADDPFLTIWQMLAASVMQLAFLAAAPEVGFVFLAVLFIVFSFGVLRLRRAEAATMWAITVTGVIVLLGSVGVPLAIPLRSPAERWVTGLCFAMALGRAAAAGLLGSQYRERLSERTAALEVLTAGLEAEVALRTRELGRANAELERVVAERTAEIATLQGVLPICSHCKKIRDDKGAWNQLEAYISDRAGVSFSPGICAECLRRFYR
jgi:hypothetical protein